MILANCSYNYAPVPSTACTDNKNFSQPVKVLWLSLPIHALYLVIRPHVFQPHMHDIVLSTAAIFLCSHFIFISSLSTENLVSVIGGS